MSNESIQIVRKGLSRYWALIALLLTTPLVLFSIHSNDPPRASAAISDIKIRFVQLRNTSCTGECSTPLISNSDIQSILSETNVVIGPNDFNVVLQSNKTFGIPLLASMDQTGITWSEIKNDIPYIFTGAEDRAVPLNAYYDEDSKTAGEWRSALASVYGGRSYVFSWIIQGGGQSYSSMPWTGHSIHLTQNNLLRNFGGTNVISTGHLAHELGHYLGLIHTFELLVGIGPKNPSGSLWYLPDSWDLLYCDSTTGRFKFFSSKSDYSNFDWNNCPQGVKSISMDAYDRYNENYVLYVDLEEESTGSTYTYAGWSNETQGLMKDLGGGHSPPTYFRYALNAMEYISHFGLSGSTDANALRVPAFLNDSQETIIKQYLLVNTGTGVPIDVHQIPLWMRVDGSTPVGAPSPHIYSNGWRPFLPQ